MKLPPIRDARRYVGLYVYDFGTHVSVGYTAAEIRTLRESQDHRGGAAYEIYRATEAGGFELRGARDERLSAREAICFLRQDGGSARRDFEWLRNAAADSPVPVRVEMYLAELQEFSPPHATGLVYPVAASVALSGWLDEHAFDGGDRVIGGTDVCATLLSAEPGRTDSCQLAALLDYTDRSREEVLEAVHQAVQR